MQGKANTPQYMQTFFNSARSAEVKKPNPTISSSELRQNDGGPPIAECGYRASRRATFDVWFKIVAGAVVTLMAWFCSSTFAA